MNIFFHGDEPEKRRKKKERKKEKRVGGGGGWRRLEYSRRWGYSSFFEREFTADSYRRVVPDWKYPLTEASSRRESEERKENK